jgi:hypothetical protein
MRSLSFYLRFALTYYVKHGQPTSEPDNSRQALRFVRWLYGSTPAVEFGPKVLKNVWVAMTTDGPCATRMNVILDPQSSFGPFYFSGASGCFSSMSRILNWNEVISTVPAF